jgi:hydroxyacylglutathione hydrolase
MPSHVVKLLSGVIQNEPGKQRLPYFHQLASHLDDVPSNKSVATVCGSGNRSSIATSILKREGFEPLNIAGGMDAWKGAGYSVTE